MNTNLLFKFLGNNVKQHFVNNLTTRLLKECFFEWSNSLFGRKRMDNPAWFNHHRRTGRSSSHAELRHVSHMPNNRAEGTSAALRHRRTGRSSSHAELRTVGPWGFKVQLKSGKVLTAGDESSTFLGLKSLGFIVLSDNYFEKRQF